MDFLNLIDKKKLIIFDFDGVLVDSVDVKKNAFGEMYAKYGNDIVNMVHEHHIENGGLSRFEKFRHYHKNFLGIDLDQNSIDEMAQEFSTFVIQKVVDAQWIPGAKKFLEKLYEAKKKCVVVSATPQNEIELIVEERNMSHYFSEIYGSPVSKYDNLMKTLENNFINSDDAIFFGDALADWNSSKNANIQFVGVGELIKELLSDNKELESYLFITNFEKFKYE